MNRRGGGGRYLGLLLDEWDRGRGRDRYLARARHEWDRATRGVTDPRERNVRPQDNPEN